MGPTSHQHDKVEEVRKDQGSHHHRWEATEGIIQEGGNVVTDGFHRLLDDVYFDQRMGTPLRSMHGNTAM
jgi:hypothetical protein